MKNRIWIVAVIFAFAAGCDTRRDILDDGDLWVRVQLDWSQAGVTPQRATVAFYSDPAVGEPILLRTNETYDSIRLRRGNYRILAFNETPESFDRVSLRNFVDYDLAEAYVQPQAMDVRNTAIYHQHPDVVATDCLSAFQVTHQMVLDRARPLLTFIPQPVTIPVRLIVHVQGLDNAAPSGSLAAIDGFAEGAMLASRTATAISVAHVAVLNDRMFDEGSYRNGTVRANYLSFDLSTTPDRQNDVMLRFRLRNGTMHPDIVRDVTHLIHREHDADGEWLEIEIGLGVPGDDLIILPDVPDVSDPGAGFDAEIDDWTDEELIDIPI